MDPDVMASSELTALLQAQDGDEVQHQHLAAAAAEEGVPSVPEHTRSDYEASRRAVFQVSGLCCRPGCTRPAWRNPGGGRGSAFCTSRHANRCPRLPRHRARPQHFPSAGFMIKFRVGWAKHAPNSTSSTASQSSFVLPPPFQV